MTNFSIVLRNEPIELSVPKLDLSILSAKISNRLWVGPADSWLRKTI